MEGHMSRRGKKLIFGITLVIMMCAANLWPLNGAFAVMTFVMFIMGIMVVLDEVNNAPGQLLVGVCSTALMLSAVFIRTLGW